MLGAIARAALVEVVPVSKRIPTVRQYAKRWTGQRIKERLTTAIDERARLDLYAMPAIGKLRLDKVRPRHIRDLVKSLRTRGELAPRTVRHVYGSLHTMFHDAVVEEIIVTNPCILKRGELPRSIDKDPTWRAGAIFTRAELHRLILDSTVPPDRRIMYALLGVTGVRFGEASALRWRAYDSAIEPLGRLLVVSSWATKIRREKPTKTEQPRSIPVHPVLANLLGRWKSEGWRQMMGRDAGPDDLIVPSRRGLHRSRHHALEKFRDDLV